MAFQVLEDVIPAGVLKRQLVRVAPGTDYMHDLCMATKTISVRIEAYARLVRARRYPDESFSEVVLRASWPDETVTGAELLQRYRDHGPFLSEDAVTRIEQLKANDLPPEDKWAGS